MLELLSVIGRALTLARRGHRELLLENLALPQQPWQRARLAGVKSGRHIDTAPPFCVGHFA